MSINQDYGSYRRGVVLGLTLAEVFVLLVFCLLLLLALNWRSVFNTSGTNAHRKEAIEKIIGELEKGRGSKPIEEYWREVKIAHERTVQEKQLQSPNSDATQVLRELEAERGAKPLLEYWREIKTKITQNIDQSKKILELERRLQFMRVEVWKNKQDNTSGKETIESQKTTIAKLESENAELREANKKAIEKAAGHTWPPIIILKEAEGYRFASGDSSLSIPFQDKLKSDVVREILRNAQQYNVDIIEIVGHTDEQPVQSQGSNLDIALLPALRNEPHVRLRAADNAGLGMARAAAVAQYLRNVSELKDYEILPLSSAQVVDVNGRLSDGKHIGDVPERRRIEIRLRRSNSATVVDGDTIRLGSKLTRLYGIDAPESDDVCQRSNGTNWPCGKAATDTLRQMLTGKAVTCRPVDEDRFGRDVSICQANGTDISCEMAKLGLAVDWPRYSKGRYVECERQARQSKLGIWDSNACQPFMVKRRHAGCGS